MCFINIYNQQRQVSLPRVDLEQIVKLEDQYEEWNIERYESCLDRFLQDMRTPETVQCRSNHSH